MASAANTSLDVRAASEDAVIIHLAVELQHPAALRNACDILRQQPWVVDLVPAYTSILVYHDVLKPLGWLQRRIKEALYGHELDRPTISTKLHLPCWYDFSVAEDLPAVARRHGLTIADFIAIHSACEYDVYAIGFMPNFAYLGYISERIATPRRDQPRAAIASGSVGIADRQTAVYMQASPAGWNIVGRVPSVEPLRALNIGDSVRFQPIDQREFLALSCPGASHPRGQKPPSDACKPRR